MALLKYAVFPWINDRRDCLTHEVDPSDVPPEIRTAANRVNREVSAALGLTPPRIRWLPPEAKNGRGWVFPAHPAEIWVRLQMLDEVVETVGHEVRHALQDRRPASLPPWERGSEEARETAAHVFGLEVARRFRHGEPLVDQVPPATRTAARPSTTAATRTAPPTTPAAPSTGYRWPIFERKDGARYAICPACADEITINGSTHRCPAARFPLRGW